jgi:hypothetical protein
MGYAVPAHPDSPIAAIQKRGPERTGDTNVGVESAGVESLTAGCRTRLKQDGSRVAFAEDISDFDSNKCRP